MLYSFEAETEVKAPLLITHFVGGTDAGKAGSIAIDQLLASLPGKRIATFNTDELLDYSTQRPTVTIDEWQVVEVSSPEIVLDLIHDDSGTPILILHGPEPSLKWKTFTKEVTALAKNAGVELVISMKGMPASIPHTRGPLVHLQASDPELVKNQPPMGRPMDFPASMNTFLAYALNQEGIESISFLVTVPFYLSAATYTQGGLALLNRVAQLLDVRLPIGNLEEVNDVPIAEIPGNVVETEELATLLRSLEQHYDEQVFPAMLDNPDTLASLSDTFLHEQDIDVDALAETIEKFLERAEEEEN
ncbi:PAC2 family protein [Gleimia coleocanis]|nr:PAC2 family protein [Gleimia coleocanis]